MRFKPNKRSQYAVYLETVDKRASSAGVILARGDQALIVKSSYKPTWNFPGGFIEAGESPRVAAARELLEEVGIEVSSDDLNFTWVFSRHSEIADTYQFSFSAKLEDWMVEAVKLQESEIEAWKIVTKTEVLGDRDIYSESVNAWAEDFTGGYVEHDINQ